LTLFRVAVLYQPIRRVRFAGRPGHPVAGGRAPRHYQAATRPRRLDDTVVTWIWGDDGASL
jgi:hypothetical protein